MAGTKMAGSPASCNGLLVGESSAGYAIVADQLDKAASRFFGSNADGVIYEHNKSFGMTMPESGVPPDGAPLK